MAIDNLPACGTMTGDDIKDRIDLLVNQSNDPVKGNDALNEIVRSASIGNQKLRDDLSSIGISTPVESVEPTDFYGINCYDHYGDWAYGQVITGDGQVVRVNLVTKQQENVGNALPQTGIRNIKVLSETTMIVEAEDLSDIYTYYKTVDSGATWTSVLVQDIANVRMLTNRSMCIADIAGSTVLFLGEYSINGSRVDGSTNDRIRLLRSDDMGDTWTAVTEWNTDGTNNNVRHIHAVKQNPNNSRIYVITGDSNTQSCIYSWDGVSAWPSNVNPADVVQTTGLKNVSGRQAFRTVDLLFKDNLIYIMPDAPTSGFGNDTECGIWSISADLELSTLKRLSTVSTHMTGIAGWLAIWLPDGRQAWLGGNEILTAGEKYNCIILSNPELTEWATVGAYRSTDVSSFIVPLNMFLHGDEIVVSCSTGSGKSDGTTVSCKPTGKPFKGAYDTLYTPDTIHPVYWIDSENGLDTNDGWTPRTPFKTPVYAVSSGRVTNGGRLQVIGDRLDVKNAISPDLGGNARAGDPTEFACIQGGGALSTKIVYNADAASTTFVNIANNDPQKFEFRDISVQTELNAINGVECFAAPLSGSHEFRSVRCIWGEYLPSDTRFSRIFRSSNCKVSVYGSVVKVFNSASLGALDTKTAGLSDYYLEDSVFLMGNHHATIKGSNNKLAGYKCKFIGAADASIEIAASTSFDKLSFLDCDFFTSGVKSSVAVSDLSGLVWAGEIKRAKGNQSWGVDDAFDGYSVKLNSVIPLIKYEDYLN